ncbi:pirin-like C-terminal cupin domain-containing protein [Pengzhenrongella sicca]|uniref:pirin-like C-terminal cupin domain-containing protein n=1 Tax=Pengzhenrongella sicca TaxID=2819238 RepID=UPI001D0C3BC3|nr:pirin-like C-terminal cupin domain-containing protein [Pengzhenrongella sicca]
MDLPRGSRSVFPLDPTFEHAVLVDRGAVRVEGTTVAPSSLAYLPPGRSELLLEAGAADDHARIILIGGVPFGEEIVMWWNFVGRSPEEVVAAREQWQTGLASGSARFVWVDGFDGPPLPAPELPNLRLRPRR